MPSFVRTQEVEHEIGSKGSFLLRATNPEMEVHGAEGNTARVMATFEIQADSDFEADQILERSRFQVVTGNGSLEVLEPKTASNIGSLARLFGLGRGASITRIQARVPAGAEISVNGVSSEVTAIGLTGSQQYRTVSGDLVVDRVGGDIRIRGVSGDVSLRAQEPLSGLEVNTVSGDVSVVAPRIDQLRVVTVSGDVEVEAALAEGPRHRVETVSGDLSLGVVGDVSVEVRGLSTDVDASLPHRTEGSRDRRRYVVGAGGPDLLFSSMSGDVSMSFARRVGPTPPTPPTPATPPTPPTPATPPAPATPVTPVVTEDEQLGILRALERGEIDVEEASRRLAGEDRA